MLRGPQTPGELRQRSERLYAFATADELEELLERLAGRRMIVRCERRPGQKEARWGLGEAFGDRGAAAGGGGAGVPPERAGRAVRAAGGGGACARRRARDARRGDRGPAGRAARDRRAAARGPRLRDG